MNKNETENTHSQGNITRQLSSLTGLESTKQENVLFFLCSESAESQQVKLEISCTMKLSLLWRVLSELGLEDFPNYSIDRGKVFKDSVHMLVWILANIEKLNYRYVDYFFSTYNDKRL